MFQPLWVPAFVLMQQGEQVSCKVTSTDLKELVKEINATTATTGSPMVFDLQGLEIEGQLLNTQENVIEITGNNVILCNGTISLGAVTSGAKLCVHGSDVTFERVTIKGGATGLVVFPGGSVTMNQCMVQDASCGIEVGDLSLKATLGLEISPNTRAIFDAYNTSVIGYQTSGVTVHSTAKVQMTDCCVAGGDDSPASAAVSVQGEMSARRLVCMDNTQHGLVCHGGGTAILEQCNITSSTSATPDVKVTDAGSTVRMCYCTLSKLPVSRDGGKILDIRVVSCEMMLWNITD